MLSYLSSPYSWVGGGETVSVSSEDGFAITAYPSGNGIAFAINDFASNPDFQTTRWWNLNLSTGQEQPLTVGSYAGATRHPFNEPGTPGLDFSGNGAGNNTLTGSFEVLETNLADDGTLLSFAADFVQYDEGSKNGWSKGAIRFNSDLPITLTPEPINEAELIELGYLPDPDLIVSEDPPSEEPQSEEQPIVLIPEFLNEETPIIDPPLIAEEGTEFCWIGSLSCPPPIGAIDPWDGFLFPIEFEPEIVWMFSSGSSTSVASSPPIGVNDVFTTRIEDIPAAGSPIATPGPLPVAAALAGWQSARRLRRRSKGR